MYLQRMVCMGMHVLCCLGTQGRSTQPDESALTVNLSNEYEVKSVDERGNMIEQKTYRIDMCFQWDREVLGRAVEMLGGQQSHVSAREMETILRAMADLSTTQREQTCRVQEVQCRFSGTETSLLGQSKSLEDSRARSMARRWRRICMQWHTRAQGKSTCCMCLSTKIQEQGGKGRLTRSCVKEISLRRHAT
eukprot:jgi/Antlo1/2489/2586